jgi:hypothetical protein
MPTGSLARARYGAAIALLPSGRVLLAGGYAKAQVILVDLDIYDPVTGRWSAAAQLLSAIDQPLAAPLRDGRVLVAGLSPALMYDEASGSWRRAGGQSALTAAGNSLLALPDGRVMLLGLSGQHVLAWLYDPSTDAWHQGQPLNLSLEFGATASLLPSGEVMVAGGGVIPADWQSGANPAASACGIQVGSGPQGAQAWLEVLSSSPQCYGELALATGLTWRQVEMLHDLARAWPVPAGVSALLALALAVVATRRLLRRRHPLSSSGGHQQATR